MRSFPEALPNLEPLWIWLLKLMSSRHHNRDFKLGLSMDSSIFVVAGSQNALLSLFSACYTKRGCNICRCFCEEQGKHRQAFPKYLQAMDGFSRAVSYKRKKTFIKHNPNKIKVSIHMVILNHPASALLCLLVWIKQALLHPFLKLSVRFRSKGPLGW